MNRNALVVSTTFLALAFLKIGNDFWQVPPHTYSAVIFAAASIATRRSILFKLLFFALAMILLVTASRTDLGFSGGFIDRLVSAAVTDAKGGELDFLARFGFFYAPLLFVFFSIDLDQIYSTFSGLRHRELRRAGLLVLTPIIFVLSARDLITERLELLKIYYRRRGIDLSSPVQLMARIVDWGPLVVVQSLLVAMDYTHIHEALKMRLATIDVAYRKQGTSLLIVISMVAFACAQIAHHTISR